MRVGNAERDRALAVLGDHMRAGRLTPDEYSSRSSRVLSAATGSDLNAVFFDLPGGFGAAAPGTSAAEVTPAASGYPASGPTYPPPSYEHPNRVAPSAAPAVPEHSFDLQRWLPAIGSASFILFFVCGFLFHGWAWSWLFFLVPGLLAAFPHRR